MNKYYKIYPISGDETNVEVVLDTNNYNLNDLDDKTLDNLIDMLDSLGFEDKTDEDYDTYDMPKMEDMQNDFMELSNAANKFISKYGNPHSRIIVDQEGIEVLQGVKANSFEVKD